MVPVGTDTDRPAASYAFMENAIACQRELELVAPTCVEEEPTESKRSFGSVSSPWEWKLGCNSRHYE